MGGCLRGYLLFNTCLRGSGGAAFGLWDQRGLSLGEIVSQASRKGCAGNGAEFRLCSPHKFQGAGTSVATCLPGLPVAFLMPLR